MERIPRTGELYRHFKNKLYQIVAVAAHSETGEQLVIYQALYGDYQVYARPLAMFTGEVDHVKYPDVKQKFRFERVEREELAGTDMEKKRNEVAEASKKEDVAASITEKMVIDSEIESSPTRNEGVASIDEAVNPKLMAFIDAEDMEEKYNILISMRDEVNDYLINSMAVVLDVVIPEGEISNRYEQLKHCIRTKQRYETLRMR